MTATTTIGPIVDDNRTEWKYKYVRLDALDDIVFSL